MYRPENIDIYCHISKRYRSSDLCFLIATEGLFQYHIGSKQSMYISGSTIDFQRNDTEKMVFSSLINQ